MKWEKQANDQVQIANISKYCSLNESNSFGIKDCVAEKKNRILAKKIAKLIMNIKNQH